MLEGELFGHERGAYTGAHASNPGLIEATDTGTVFLDEIGELPITTQAKLLRVLEERTVMRIGSNKSTTVDVRFITATNRALAAEVRAGRFRSDLYYRISGLLLDVPPLRQRQVEIEPLARHFLSVFCRRSHLPVPRLTDDAVKALCEHSWPGNVRELRNVVERAALLATNSVITRENIGACPSRPTIRPDRRVGVSACSPLGSASNGAHSGFFLVPPSDVVDADEHPPSTRVNPRLGTPMAPHRETERLRILQALEACGGNQTRAAKMLNLSRRTLINRLEEFDLPRPKKG